MIKVCKECKKTKDISQFGKLSRTKDGLKSKCKMCVKHYNKQHPIKTETKDKFNKKRREARAKIKDGKIRSGEIKIRFDDGRKRECTTCGEIKVYSDFHNASRCKECERTRYMEWYNNGGKKKVIAYQKKYRKANIKKCKMWAKTSRENTPKNITAERGREWRSRNKDKMKELKKAWREKILKKTESITIKEELKLAKNI